MDLQEISDRLEIQDLHARYAYAVDTQAWDVLDRTFTPDASIDYSATGGTVADSREDAKRWLAATLPGPFVTIMHSLAQLVIDLDGDTASAKAYLHNPMSMDDGRGGTTLVELGLVYHNELVRTPDGWRISSLRQELKWDRGLR